MTTRLLHNIGPKFNENYNTREEVLVCDDFLTFDGVYQNVFENRDVLKGKKGILFITGFLGKDNSFDVGMPLEKFCTMKEIMQLEDETGFEIGWHTWTHRDLTKLSDYDLELELNPPFECKSFAYPHGTYDKRVIDAVKKAGYERAYSVTQGDDSQYALRRDYL